MTARHIAGSLLALCLAATASASDSPRSVIPWLSESLSQDPWDDSNLPAFRDPNPDAAGLTPFSDERIVTSSLDATVREGVGLILPAEAGFPADIWGRSSALRARALVLDRTAAGVPETRRLYRDILVAETPAPLGAGASNALLLARLDGLMRAGLLDDARAILAQLDLSSPEVFRRAFDVALLIGEEEAMCARLRASPALSPSLMARIFCLARGGDWDAAALTLQTGHDLGFIPPEHEALLAQFLDPALAESAPVPPSDTGLTTLEFVIRESIALPRPARMPLAFSYLDTHDGNALRTRMDAFERLAAQAVTAAYAPLFETYRSGKPASSGGIWDRSKAVQDLDDAMAIAEPERITRTLLAADATLTPAGLRHAFAWAYRRQLAALDPKEYPLDTRRRVFELLCLADMAEEAQPWLDADGSAQAQLRAALVDPQAPPSSLPLPPLEGGVMAGLSAEAAPDDQAAEIAALFDTGQFAEAMFRTLDLLKAGPESDPQDIAAALYLLRHAGLTDAARRTASQLLLLLEEA